MVSTSGLVESVGEEAHRAQSLLSVIGASPFPTLDGSTETLRRLGPQLHVKDILFGPDATRRARLNRSARSAGLRGTLSAGDASLR